METPNVDESEQELLNVLREYTMYLEEEPYHTPKNIFNHELARMSLASSINTSTSSHHSPPTSINLIPENHYSTLKVTKPYKMTSFFPTQTIGLPCHQPHPIKHIHPNGHEEKNPDIEIPLHNKPSWLSILLEGDLCDYLLTVGLIATTIFFIFGVYMLYIQ
ncbi:unnamed protein product [Auanema sp. JU1783]|nr:unnamed protein product [Auanema sp. JU1783]